MGAGRDTGNGSSEQQDIGAAATATATPNAATASDEFDLASVGDNIEQKRGLPSDFPKHLQVQVDTERKYAPIVDHPPLLHLRHHVHASSQQLHSESYHQGSRHA